MRMPDGSHISERELDPSVVARRLQPFVRADARKRALEQRGRAVDPDDLPRAAPQQLAE